MRIFKTVISCCMLLASLEAFPQAKPKTSGAKPSVATVANKPATGPTITAEEVDSFMKHMFGAFASMKWRIVDISPSGLSGVTRVVLSINDTQSQVFYVMPGGKFAMVGDLIPFGADPFAPVRDKLAAEAHGPEKGAAVAPVLVVEFSDLECPHCKVAQPVIDKLIAESPNAKFVYQPFPLPMHPWARKAALYADCVHTQNPDAFWKFINGIYDAQAEITEATADKKFSDLAMNAGVDAAQVASCSAKPETEAKIKKSMDLGIEVGVTGTPTLFIAGRSVQGITNESLVQMKAMIEFEAKQKK